MNEPWNNYEGPNLDKELPGYMDALYKDIDEPYIELEPEYVFGHDDNDCMCACVSCVTKKGKSFLHEYFLNLHMFDPSLEIQKVQSVFTLRCWLKPTRWSWVFQEAIRFKRQFKYDSCMYKNALNELMYHVREEPDEGYNFYYSFYAEEKTRFPIRVWPFKTEKYIMMNRRILRNMIADVYDLSGDFNKIWNKAIWEMNYLQKSYENIFSIWKRKSGSCEKKIREKC